jgi:hypothetical protein
MRPAVKDTLHIPVGRCCTLQAAHELDRDCVLFPIEEKMANIFISA